MELKHIDPSVQSGDPYKYCCTGRKTVGQSLNAIINSTDLGCTISLTGEWGTGKTTFLRMWRQDLIDQDFPTILLNAWRTEWAEDPLIAVISCVFSVCKKEQPDESIKRINNILKKFVKHPLSTIEVLLRTIIDAKFGVDLSNISDELKNLSTWSFDGDVESFGDRESALEELKSSLEKLAWDVKQVDGRQKPLVFIIDELDRCKPDYAVRMLEVLKHFFDVKNIIFVCAIDKKHLEDSIKGYYGCEGLNATEYLRRFFDLEIELPTPDYTKFCAHLYDYYELDKFFDSDDRKMAGFREDGSVFRKFLVSLALKSNLTLRQIERICAFTRLSLLGKGTRIYYYPTLSLFVTYLRFFDYPFYQDLKNHKMTVQDLLERVISEYGKIIDRKLDYSDASNNHRAMLFMIGKLIVSYNNVRTAKSENIYDYTNKSTPLSCSFFTQEELNDSIGYACYGGDSYELSWLFDILDILKIDGSR